MKRRHWLGWLIVLAPLETLAAQVQVDWTAVWGGVGDEETIWFGQDPLGDLVAIGNATGPGILGSDLLYMRFSPQGLPLVTQRMDLGSSSESVEGFHLDSAGILSAAGRWNDEDALIFELDATGSPNWAVTWDASDHDHLDSVVVDAGNSRVHATGGTGSGPQEDVLLLTFDRAGNLLSSLRWDDGGSQSINSSALHFGPGGEVSLYAVGNHDLGGGFLQALVMKLDVSPGLSAPVVDWIYTWGGSATDDAYACAVDDASGAVYVTGNTESFVAGTAEDIFVLKVEPDGTLAWDISWGGFGEDSAEIQFLDGRLVVTGNTDQACVTTGLLMELDPATGEVEWTQTWGGCGGDFFSLVEGPQGWYGVGVTTSYEGTLHSCAGTPFRTDVPGQWNLHTGSWSPVSGTMQTPVFSFSNAPTQPGSGTDVLLLHLVDQEIGSNYCTADFNSTCSPATLHATGSASIASNDLVLHARLVPDNAGIFFYGPGQQSVPFGNGTLCVSGPIGRLSVEFASGNELRHEVDYSMPPTAATAITPGSTWHFQAWYRDPNVGANFDLSDGLSISFLP